MAAELCPVCSGSGQVRDQNLGQITAAPEPKTCHGCGGRGWVETATTIPGAWPSPRPYVTTNPTPELS